MYGAKHSRTVKTTQRMIDLYEAWQKPKKAEEFAALLGD